MKKYLIMVLIIIVGCFMILFKDNKQQIKSNNDALALGEEKYMIFLWFVDSAFTSNEYYVNNQKLSKDKYPFTCNFNKEKNKCYVKDFYNVFEKYFASNVSLDKVYNDGILSISYQLDNKDVIFNIGVSCGLTKTNVDHYLEIKKIEKDTITYLINFFDEGTSKVHQYTKEFVLKYENGLWKISKAYYRDRCRMGYNIE